MAQNISAARRGSPGIQDLHKGVVAIKPSAPLHCAHLALPNDTPHDPDLVARRLHSRFPTSNGPRLGVGHLSTPARTSASAMGVIRKKIAARGGEGGVKYVCDVCSADITSTVSDCPPPSWRLVVRVLPHVIAGRLFAMDFALGPPKNLRGDLGVGGVVANEASLRAGPHPMRPQRMQTTTISASSASPTASAATRISRPPTRTGSLSRTRSRYSTKNGAQTRSCCCWRAPRRTGWVVGRHRRPHRRLPAQGRGA